MTLVTAALDRIARSCSLDTPTSWLAATDAEYVEIRDDFLAETVQDILDRVDLPSPIGKQQTIAGDGSASYSLNADFARLQRDQLAVYDTGLDRPCVPVTDDGQWTYLQDLGTAGVVRYYRLDGYKDNWSIEFYAAPTTNITVSYISDLWVANAGSFKDSFNDPDDTLLLPREVVEAGTIWRWRERKGLPFQAKFNEYELKMSRLSNDRRGRRMINMGNEPREVRWQDLVPSFIPPS